MMPFCLAFLMFFQNPETEYFSQSSESFLASDLPNQTLSFKNTNRELLNATFFHLINQLREQKKLDSLRWTIPLFMVAKDLQNQLEFKPFNDPKKIDAKVNLKLSANCKNAGYKGTLVKGLSAQNAAINYDGKSEFFFDKTDKTNEFPLYYGNIKQKKQGKNLVLIPNYTYLEFVQNLLKNLPSETLKQLQNSSYSHIGIQLQWNYKTLGKNQIPQIKLLCIVGGFQTAGIR